MKTIAVILGTRPEIIKLAPLIKALRESSEFQPYVIASGQHREMAAQAFVPFALKPDVDLALMTDNQSLGTLLADAIVAIEKTLAEICPIGVLVQGDTTTALAGALAAYHLQIPVGHVEAGLRTYDIYSPYPEELNRTFISRIAELHFCPTEGNVENLRREGITDNIFVTGNTVIDALFWITEQLDAGRVGIESSVSSLQLEKKRYVLVTGHRRENFDQPLCNLCEALRRLVEENSDLEIVYPVHRNPNVVGPVHRELSEIERIHLLEPVDYPSLVYLMRHCECIISDSGGIQEEAPSLGKLVLVTRRTTERPEALEAGTAKLADLNQTDSLYDQVQQIALSSRAAAFPSQNPFGDGKASKHIVTQLERKW